MVTKNLTGEKDKHKLLSIKILRVLGTRTGISMYVGSIFVF
jgi:hypothetical protein